MPTKTRRKTNHTPKPPPEYRQRSGRTQALVTLRGRVNESSEFGVQGSAMSVFELLLLGGGSFWAFLFAVIQLLLPFLTDAIGAPVVQYE